MTTSMWSHLSAGERGSNHRGYVATDQALCRNYRIYAEEDLDETRAMCNKTRMNLDSLSEMGFIVVLFGPIMLTYFSVTGIGRRCCCWS